jgi:hypothetical protein
VTSSARTTFVKVALPFYIRVRVDASAVYVAGKPT